jgi:radical SAM protein with 4Fe4S-binding SPASM domain
MVAMERSVKRIHPVLPIFLLATENRSVFYTPGHFALVDAGLADAIQQAWWHPSLPDETTARKVSIWLQGQAQQVFENRQKWLQTPFGPECLTIYLSNHCNCECSYCYVAPQRKKIRQNTQSFPVIAEEVVCSAARLVARNCATQGKPFFLILHGGGEPTMHWELVQRIEAITRQIAEQFEIGWFGYIATNGILSAEQAQWLATHFERIGLSCDGPPEIQNRQRPLQGGAKTSAIVERTARIIKAAGGHFEVRTTITPQTIERQREIVRYLHERLQAETIRFEPVYHVRGGGSGGFLPDDAARFVAHFLDAQTEARQRGVTLTFSGVRLAELHSSYCDVLRNVLHLTPDGKATACFFCTDGQTSEGSPYVIGYPDHATGEFVLDQKRIEAHRQRAWQVPERCHDCLNVYHCARGCPEFCGFSLEDSRSLPDSGSLFRCQVQQQLAQTWILEAAEQLITANPPLPEDSRSLANSGSLKSTDNLVKSYLCEAPSSVDVDAILHQWEAVKTRYNIELHRMPSPIWAERGFEHHGFEAWQQVTYAIQSSDAQSPMAIYIHIPFCDRKCGFCDCHALPLGKQNRQETEETYVRILLNEIQAWAAIPPLSRRPVSTIHFGGGTPNYLSPALFARILDECRAQFTITAETEFALESTSSLLTTDHLTWLRTLGFSRLHVGIQTLEEPLRKTIGRREPAAIVLEKLVQAIEMDFITSVDVIYGLPGQTLPGLLCTLEQLVTTRIHGVSLYQLNISSRNRRFLEQRLQFTPDMLYNYVLFQAADQFLTCRGYHKNHFTHFAKSEDQNCYYTHAQRGEDLLALGATADGIFGAYHYRHPEYEEYLAGAQAAVLALEGGIRENSLEQCLRPAITALMTGNITRHVLQSVEAEPLLDQWIESVLVKEEPGDRFILTANGSWLVNEMISELRNWFDITIPV